jgi:hypothetical protein
MPDGQIIEHERLVGKRREACGASLQGKHKETGRLSKGRVPWARSIMGSLVEGCLREAPWRHWPPGNAARIGGRISLGKGMSKP